VSIRLLGCSSLTFITQHGSSESNPEQVANLLHDQEVNSAPMLSGVLLNTWLM